MPALGRIPDPCRISCEDRDGPKAALLGDLFAVFLAPYDDKGVLGGRIHVSLPTVRIGEISATTLALIVHELATNSVKHGSLSAEGGSLGVSYTEDDGNIAIVWTERGGPKVSVPKGPGGFGSKLISQSIPQQLGGSMEFDWQAEGVVITLRMSKARLTA